MPSVDYHWLRQHLNIQDILQRMHWHASEQRGDQRRGPCPFCRHTSPGSPSSWRCFSVHFARNIFHCFHCHRRGNALDLWADYQQLPLHDAAHPLRNYAMFMVLQYTGLRTSELLALNLSH